MEDTTEQAINEKEQLRKKKIQRRCVFLLIASCSVVGFLARDITIHTDWKVLFVFGVAVAVGVYSTLLIYSHGEIDKNYG